MLAMRHTSIRLFTEQPLHAGSSIALADKEAHYLVSVMRADIGDTLRLFNGRDGEWNASVVEKSKSKALLKLNSQHAPQRRSLPMTVCFAPPRGGRIDSIIEKATELGASVLQPLRTHHSVVDKINEEKWAATVREAAEQCERMDVPEIRPLVTLPQLLGAWPKDAPLLHGDESGASAPIVLRERPKSWGLLIGPEGGFSEAERGLIARVPSVQGVSLGPRILRVDTAVITLLALSAQAWGDWELRPHFGN